MDIETMSNCAIFIFEKLNGSNRHVFVINRERNDIIPLLIFLKSNVENKDWHLGFNNISFDAQIIEFILDNFSTLEENDSDYISSLLCKYADTIIQRTKNNQFLDYYQNKFRIPVIDIYKMNNWDSAAKRSSLKWIQFSMDWHNVQEMPYHYLDYVTNDDMLNEVIEYCINDVSSTKAIFKHVENGKKVMIEQIKLRSELSTTYKINLYSASEPKISKEVFLHFLEKKLNIPKKIIKEYRTFRDKVVIKDIILPEIKFDTYQFKAVLNWFNNLVVDTKVIEGDDDKIKGPSYTMNYNNVTTVYALGGLHGCATAGVYTPGIGQTIKSVDVNFLRLNSMNCWNSCM